MKTFALVDLGGIRHTVDDFEEAKGLRDGALQRGIKLILVKPMETIVDKDWLAAIELSVKRGEAANTTELGEMIMAAIDDLRAALDGLKAEVADSSAKFKALADKLAATPAGNDEEIKAITAELVATTAALDAATADKPVDAPPSDPTVAAPEPPPV